VVLYGHSLGGGVSHELAVRHPELAGLVTDSTFTSTPALAGRLVPIPLLPRLVRTRYDNLEKARRVRLPRLVIHAERDALIPFDMGVTLRDATSPPAPFLAVAGAGHNDAYEVGGRAYYDAIEAFVTAHAR
jgi:fermentation-respiration switch protein FrsA (DUF1100 family)